MTRDKKWFPVAYMFLMTALFSSIVIGLTQLTRNQVQANETLALERAILSVLPGMLDQHKAMSNSEAHLLFSEKVLAPDESSAGAYVLADNGKIIAYALPIRGQGFWAPIRGIIGIAADRTTITGLAIYQQNETPGLGAEISKPEFTGPFKGKIIAAGDKPLAIKRPGSNLDPHSVHAITGATQTSVRLETILNNALKDWQTRISQSGNP